MVVVEYLQIQDSLKNDFFLLCLLCAGFLTKKQIFDNDDLFEVSFVMTCKSLPKASRKDGNKTYLSLKWEEIVGKSRRYTV